MGVTSLLPNNNLRPNDLSTATVDLICRLITTVCGNCDSRQSTFDHCRRPFNPTGRRHWACPHKSRTFNVARNRADVINVCRTRHANTHASSPYVADTITQHKTHGDVSQPSVVRSRAAATRPSAFVDVRAYIVFCLRVCGPRACACTFKRKCVCLCVCAS